MAPAADDPAIRQLYFCVLLAYTLFGTVWSECRGYRRLIGRSASIADCADAAISWRLYTGASSGLMTQRRAIVGLGALAVLSIAAVIGSFVVVDHISIESLLGQIATWVEVHPSHAILGFAVWAIAANLIVIPSGSLTLILAGFFVGAWLPAALWWGAQVVTAPIVHTIGARSIEPALVERLLQRAGLGASIEVLRLAARREGFLASAVLRLTPLLPGAPGAVIAAAAGICRTKFTLATLAVGWLRPLYFASLGAALPALADPSGLLNVRTLLPLAGLFAVVAGGFGARLWIARRSARQLA
jgi:uncharacterized membrane protein YdjX (TVP38/TMEM64 family)